jgi:hypothetical protein
MEVDDLVDFKSLNEPSVLAAVVNRFLCTSVWRRRAATPRDVAS